MKRFFKALGGRLKTARELIDFLWQNRLWWLLPIVIVLLLVTVLIALTSSSAVVPFIYTLF